MSHDELDYANRIREGGHRLTPQRQIILDTLCSLGGHVPITTLVEAVQQATPAIDRATVYRSIGFFDGLGLVVSSEIDGATVVEIPTGDAAFHSHLVCRRCGHVEHVPDSLFTALTEHLETAYGFAANLDRLTIEGTCHECGAGSNS